VASRVREKEGGGNGRTLVGSHLQSLSHNGGKFWSCSLCTGSPARDQLEQEEFQGHEWRAESGERQHVARRPAPPARLANHLAPRQLPCISCLPAARVCHGSTSAALALRGSTPSPICVLQPIYVLQTPCAWLICPPRTEPILMRFAPPSCSRSMGMMYMSSYSVRSSTTST